MTMVLAMVLIICGLMGALMWYISTQIRSVEEKVETQYIEAKLSIMQANLCLVESLLKDIK